MSEVELYLIQDGENCTIYTLQFLRDVESEFEKFVTKFREDAEYSEDFSRIAEFIKRIAKTGALERYFRPEGKMNDSVFALPVTSSKLRLYCLRLSDKIFLLNFMEYKILTNETSDNLYTITVAAMFLQQQ